MPIARTQARIDLDWLPFIPAGSDLLAIDHKNHRAALRLRLISMDTAVAAAALLGDVLAAVLGRLPARSLAASRAVRLPGVAPPR